MTDPRDGSEEGADQEPMTVDTAVYDHLEFSRTNDGRIVGQPDEDGGRVVGQPDE